MSGNFPRRGEIWQVHLPDENKRRPAVIISVNSRNETANSVIVVPLTTNLRPSPAHVLLHAGHGGLRHASIARKPWLCSQKSPQPRKLLRCNCTGIARSDRESNS